MNEVERTSLQVLMAGLAHEMNTPIGAIRGNRDVLQRVVQRLSDILADDDVDDSEIEQIRDLVRTLREVIDVDHVAVDAISNLVSCASAFWKTDAATFRSVDLHEGLESTLLLLGHELKHRIEVVREYGDVPAVECYPSQMNQVFMNLMLNASQAISGSGVVTIRTYSTGEQAVVEISDSGSGIAPEHFEEVFALGYTTKETASGMGLGLQICEEIMEQHRGRIEVESTVGTGSTFRVLLPLRGEIQ
jgi:signal transduction histidine kinase